MKKRLIILATLMTITYAGSYVIRRCTRLLVRREWVEIHPFTERYDLTIHGTDVGQGTYFNKNFRLKKDPYALLYYPLWQTELRLRGKYFRHTEIVPNGNELWESADTKDQD